MSTMELNTPSRALKQPPAGFQLLPAGQSVRAGDISRSPITDTWAPINTASRGHVVTSLNARHNIFARPLPSAREPLTEWMQDVDSAHCFMRCIVGADPTLVASRVAFIEKTPRVRMAPFSEVDDFKNWEQGPKGCAPEYGRYQPSRDWCDEQLVALGYQI